MSKKMLINASHPEENRVAIVVDGLLSELDIEIAGQEQTKGNIYKAVVVRVESGLQAAFVDYGAEKLGFLQIGELHPSLYPGKEDSKSRPRINDILHRGREILVQIVKEERGNKGAALTTFLSIPGRYMVLMPDSTTKGVSRKILEDSERKKLKKTMAELELPERMGYIVRTAGIGKSKEELKRDFDYLVRLYEGIVARQDQVKSPCQIYRESNLVIRSIRDYFSAEMDEVLIDDNKVYQDAKDFFSLVMPELAHLVKQHREKRPIFSRYQIEEQIETLSRNQIPLPSGGSIVIDQTEALVAIDVNSGKMASESGIEATAVKTNLEAASEVGRQLRLRDLGGLVVIDFIDMRDRKHIREVEQQLRKSLQDDKAKVTVGRISQFGLLEMSRQRLKPTLSVGAYLQCPHCLGKGRVKSTEAQAVAFLRQAHAAASKGQIGHIEVQVPLNVASYLLNQKRATLSELEQRLDLGIAIIGRTDFIPGQMEIELSKREKSEDSSRDIAPVSHANQIEIALAAQQEEQEVQETLADREPVEEVEPIDSEQLEEAPTEKKGRKRRRKRRKKSDQPDGETSSEAGPDQAGPAVGDAPAAATAETTEDPSATVSVAQPDAGEAEEKPAKRRRRRRKKTDRSAAESETAQEPGATEPPSAEAGEAGGVESTEKVSEPAATLTEEPPATPAKGRRRRKPAAAKTAEGDQDHQADPGSTAEGEGAPIAADPTAAITSGAQGPAEGTVEPAEGQPATPPRRRPRRRKPAAPKSAESDQGRKQETETPSGEAASSRAADVASEASSDRAPGASAEEESHPPKGKPAARKPRTRRISKSAQAKNNDAASAEQNSPESAATAPSTQPDQSTETVTPVPEAKPRTRRPRKTPQKKSEASQPIQTGEKTAPADPEATAAGSPEAPAKPKRRPRRSTVVTKEAGESSEVTEDAPKKPARKTTRRTTKKDEEKPAVAAEQPTPESPAAEEKPKRARRAPRKKPASPSAKDDPTAE